MARLCWSLRSARPAGLVTALGARVSLRLSTGVAVVTLLDHLSPRMRLSRLAGLLAHGLQLAAGRGLYGFPGGNVIAGADGLCGGRHKHPRSPNTRWTTLCRLWVVCLPTPWIRWWAARC